MKCCTSLTDVYLGNSLSVISDSMFNYCPNLSVLVIPSGVTTISRYAFSSLSENTGLTEADKDVSGVTAGDINKPYSDKNMIVTEGFTETKFEKVALSLKSQTELVMYFKNPDYNLDFDCQNNNEVEKTTTKDGYQVARIKGIRADQLGEDYVLKLLKPNANVEDVYDLIGTVEYCPLSYCYYVILEGRGTEELQNVCKALFLFYQAACDYKP